MEALRRYATLAMAGAVGIAAAVGYAYLTWTPAPSKGRPDEMETLGASLSVCAVFFGATYFSGRMFARLLNARALADEIRRNSAWHLRALMLLSALIGLQRLWFARGRGFGRLDDWIAVGFAAAFAGVAIAFEIGRLRREREDAA